MTSEEWVLIKPTGSAQFILGDEIFVQAGTDIDNIVASLRSHSVRYHNKIEQEMPRKKTIQRFEAWKVIKNGEGNYVFAYTTPTKYNLKETLEDSGFDPSTIAEELKKLEELYEKIEIQKKEKLEK